MFRRIRYRVTAVVGLTVTLGLAATGAFYTRHQEAAVLAQNERTMMKLTESVSQGLQSVMLAGSADIAQSFADRLKQVPEVSDFRILRVDGSEAFRDNQTILDVNRRRGEEKFLPREEESHNQVLPAADASLGAALASREPVRVYTSDEEGRRTLTFLAPIVNQEPCYKCHGKAHPVRGVLKLTTSLAPVERDILQVRHESLLVLGGALMATMLLTGYMMGRSVVKPLERVTAAMARVSSGDLDYSVPVRGRDELSRMAESFNRMTVRLKSTYLGLKREQDKLTTIIRSAGEGIVVTDGAGRVVLVNPAAEKLLGKPAHRIVADGMDNLLGDPDTMRGWLAAEGDRGPAPVEWNGRVLHVFASTIHNAEGLVVGSAALLRDVTDEKRLEEELRRLSTTDALTGLWNRRHMDSELAHEFQRVKRGALPLSVVMCDVDHFKRFNDEHGHDQGDRVLRAVAELMRGDLRSYDIACRYGGEEFLLILPGTPAEPAAAVAERLRALIADRRVDGLAVTASFGVATFDGAGYADPEALVEAADQALYRAKGSGRNRVASAAPAPEAGVTADGGG